MRSAPDPTSFARALDALIAATDARRAACNDTQELVILAMEGLTLRSVRTLAVVYGISPAPAHQAAQDRPGEAKGARADG